VCYNISNNLKFSGKRVLEMDVRVGDKLEMKKTHPCGEKLFTVLRSGIDFRLRCDKCGREFLIPRVKAEKNIKKVIREENND
jgi:hypothetical protein